MQAQRAAAHLLWRNVDRVADSGKHIDSIINSGTIQATGNTTQEKAYLPAGFVSWMVIFPSFMR